MDTFNNIPDFSFSETYLARSYGSLAPFNPSNICHVRDEIEKGCIPKNTESTYDKTLEKNITNKE